MTHLHEDDRIREQRKHLHHLSWERQDEDDVFLAFSRAAAQRSRFYPHVVFLLVSQATIIIKEMRVRMGIPCFTVRLLTYYY